jgi:hypothetical protein
VLVELSYFFRILCAKELSKKQVKKLEEAAPVLLCKMEKIYPPGFFQSDAAHDFAPPVRGTNGGPCTWLLVLFN